MFRHYYFFYIYMYNPPLYSPYYAASALLTGNPMVVDSMLQEHETHVKEVLQSIETVANKHKVR